MMKAQDHHERAYRFMPGDIGRACFFYSPPIDVTLPYRLKR